MRWCGLAFLDPMYEEEELAALYPSDYYAFTDRFAVSGSFPRLKSKVSGLLTPPEHKTRDPKFERPGRMSTSARCRMVHLPDERSRVGCKGSRAQYRGCRVWKKRRGTGIFSRVAPGRKLSGPSLRYVRMNHSLEHMAHPNEILDEVYRILADQGKLMIGVPNRDSFAARVFGRFWYHLALPLHAFTYSVQTLSQMLTKHNFDVEKVVFNTEQTPLLAGLQIYLTRHRASPSFHGRLPGNRLAMFFSYWAARLQNSLHVSDVIEITATKRQDQATLKQPENSIDVA